MRLVLAKKGDLHSAEVQNRLLCSWPVLVALDTPHLDLSGQHDDDARVLFPDDLPKVKKRRWEGCLGSNVGPATKGRGEEGGIDVVVASLVELMDLNTGVVKWPDVVVPVLEALLNARPDTVVARLARLHHLRTHQ